MCLDSEHKIGYASEILKEIRVIFMRTFAAACVVMGMSFAMDEAQEAKTVKNLPLTMTQIAQKSAEDIVSQQKILFPQGPETILRTSTIDDLEGTVKLLSILNVPKESTLKILETMEEELYAAAGVDASNEDDEIMSIEKYLTKILPHQNFPKDLYGQEANSFRTYMKILNIRKYYQEKSVKSAHDTVDYRFERFRESAVHWNDPYTIIIKIPDPERFICAMKLFALVNRTRKEHYAKAMELGDFNHRFTKEQIEYVASGLKESVNQLSGV